MLYISGLTKYTRLLNRRNIFQHARKLTLSNVRKEKFDKLFLQKDKFQIRHIGPRQYEQLEMLETIGFKVVF